MHPMWTIGLTEARSVVVEVVAGAGTHEAPVSVAVVDAAAQLVAFERMDGAPGFSARLAVSKAVSSATFATTTAEFEEAIGDRPVFAIGLLQHGGWYAGRGGAPILVDGQVVGAVGVSGNTAAREDDLAREAASRVSVALAASAQPVTGG
jgi:uncharacterized protein GlcG (DUF336 family)